MRGKQAYQQQLAKLRSELKESEKKLAGYEKQYEQVKEFDYISKESIADLSTQLRLISIDLVGINARIIACNKILEEREGLSAARTEQVETVKITAEIELVGLAAKKKAIETIIDKGQRRNTLSSQRSSAHRSVSHWKQEISHVAAGITHFETQLELCRPFPVQDGKIKIRRIKWEPAEKEQEAGSPPGR
jgi:chromosome segregation ATPase